MLVTDPVMTPHPNPLFLEYIGEEDDMGDNEDQSAAAAADVYSESHSGYEYEPGSGSCSPEAVCAVSAEQLKHDDLLISPIGQELLIRRSPDLVEKPDSDSSSSSSDSSSSSSDSSSSSKSVPSSTDPSSTDPSSNDPPSTDPTSAVIEQPSNVMDDKTETQLSLTDMDYALMQILGSYGYETIKDRTKQGGYARLQSSGLDLPDVEHDMDDYLMFIQSRHKRLCLLANRQQQAYVEEIEAVKRRRTCIHNELS